MNQTILGKLLSADEKQKKGLDNLTKISQRSEVTGAVERRTNAELPTAGRRGRMFFSTDQPRIDGINGTLAFDDGSNWIYILSGVVDMPSFTVAGLPTPTAPAWAFATDGRKDGEGAGVGTGVVCYWDGSGWFRPADDTAVAS